MDSAIAPLMSCCGALCAPCRQSACVAHRPRPQRLAKSRPSGGCSLAWRLRAHIAQVAPPASGGGRLVPLFHFCTSPPKNSHIVIKTNVLKVTWFT